MNWLKQSSQLVSRGITSKKATSLADLHRRREETQSQFFTPEWVAAGMYGLIKPSLDALKARSFCAAIIDTSVGSGRLLGPATPEDTAIYGLDVDERCISAVSEDAKLAGFAGEFLVGGMENVTMERFASAVINPPFSLHLDSPLMEPFDSTTFGKFGPNTAAISHEYAVEQALAGAQVVIALLPVSAREFCQTKDRLAAELCLPADTFQHEGANVHTAVFVFDSRQVPESRRLSANISKGMPWPHVPLDIPMAHYRPRLFSRHINSSEPVITLPVTGDARVILHHHNRRIIPKFFCGLTQARVMNAVLEAFVPNATGRAGHRYPKQIRHVGDGRWLLDAYLMDDDPQQALDGFLRRIEEAGGKPELSPTLAGFWRRQLREKCRALTPFKKVIRGGSQPDQLPVISKGFQLLVPGDLKSPPLRKGETLMARPDGGEYLIEKAGICRRLRRDELVKAFEVNQGDLGLATSGNSSWIEVYPGKVAAFPELANEWERRIDACVPFPLWTYQRHDLLEALIHPCGSVQAWGMGTGKARLALALACMGGKHNLIVVEGGLVAEMRREIAKVNLSDTMWQEVRTPAALSCLRKINLISIEKLKKPLHRGTKRSYAQALRRRIHTAVVDEGSFVSSPKTLQTSAIKALSPKRLYVADGTPISSYPRDMLEINQLVYGASYLQPYDRYGVYLSPQLQRSASFAPRGLDEFRDQFVVLDWASHEFVEDGRSGAKREIPVINDLEGFRGWLAPLVKRRIRYEPDCAPMAGCPEPQLRTTHIGWDQGHFRHYLTTALEFANWFRNHKRQQEEEGKRINLVVTLAKINACRIAANAPSMPNESQFAPYLPLTSKQRYVADRAQEIADAGDKVIIYAQNPLTLERIHAELARRGVDALLFHGGVPIAQRTRDLDERFRFGSCPVLLGSTGVTQRGLNLEQASSILIYDRDWNGSVEQQSIERTTRPGQTRTVQVEYVHLRGSIDEYVGQMADFKAASADAALDFGSMLNTEEFEHMDAMLERFCREVFELDPRATLEQWAA